MKQCRVIQCLASVTLAVFLLFAALWCYSGRLGEQALPLKKADTVIAADEQLTEVYDELSESEYGLLQAIPPAAVVIPPPRIGGNTTVVLLPAPAYLILVLLNVLLIRPIRFFHYFFSFFRHVFGHAIAPNAP